MANKTTAASDNLFSSLISDIKNYNGDDPLLPWIRGINTMKRSLPPQLLQQKLPRFLQKCAQTFETDIRYRNDDRYVRVWMRLLEFVKDRGAVLGNMKANHIGSKSSMFYQAYALYYERKKKFTEAEKMYHLGVQNLAEPLDDLQKSFDQFLHRMEHHISKRAQRREGQTTGNLQGDETKDVTGDILVKGRPTGGLLKNSLPPLPRKVEDKKVNTQNMEIENKNVGKFGREIGDRFEVEPDEQAGDNTVVVRFAKTAIVGKSKAEDARHHGLVEPTINTKEAMDAINSMFREPLDPEPFQNYSSHRNKGNADQGLKNGFNMTTDNDAESQPTEEPFQIYCDDEEESSEGEKDDFDHKMAPNMIKGPFVFTRPKDDPVECSKGSKFREDTAFRFVGSTILDEQKVENACHHGLVEPTVNLKEAMDDINGMFGKPIEFVRKRRPRKQEKPFDEQQNCSSFLILPDDDIDRHQQEDCRPSSSSSTKENGLFEQTICTKEAMDDINKMFAMPLDF